MPYNAEMMRKGTARTVPNTYKIHLVVEMRSQITEYNNIPVLYNCRVKKGEKSATAPALEITPHTDKRRKKSLIAMKKRPET